MNKTYQIADLGKPLFTSRSSEIYPWEEGKLLKLFFLDTNPEFADKEALNLEETYQKGVSSIKLYERVEIEGRKGLIIKKLNGQTEVGILIHDVSYASEVSKHMAELSLKLHTAETDKLCSIKDLILSSLETQQLSFLSKEEKCTVQRYVQQLPDGNAILHLDFHPDNIMTDGKNSYIIDWATAARGVPAADVAYTSFIMEEAEMMPGVSKEEAEYLQKLRMAIREDYLKRYRSVNPISDEELSEWKLGAMIIRLAVWNVKSEEMMLRKKIRDAISSLDI